MKIAISLKDPNFLDYAEKDLREQMEQEGFSEDDIDDAADALRAKFRYGEYLDIAYDVESDTLEFK